MSNNNNNTLENWPLTLSRCTPLILLSLVPTPPCPVHWQLKFSCQSYLNFFFIFFLTSTHNFFYLCLCLSRFLFSCCLPSPSPPAPFPLSLSYFSTLFCTFPKMNFTNFFGPPHSTVGYFYRHWMLPRLSHIFSLSPSLSLSPPLPHACLVVKTTIHLTLKRSL